jgi:hypothetical protein
MNFVKRQLPVLLAFVVGAVLWLQYFVPSRFSQHLNEVFNTNWGQILLTAALVLGYISAIHYHIGKVRLKREGWGFSMLTLTVFFIVAILGLFPIHVPGFKAVEMNDESFFDWVFKNMFIPLSATMFATLAFFIASAAFRAFRARSVEAAALLIAGCILLLGRVPFGEMITVWPHTPWGNAWTLSALGEWIMNNPSNAAQRGIMLGVYLAQVAISLRIIFGVERTYMGGAD